ncbi:serine/threonine protein kinase [Myxococcota bacterium]|nr:serine/threonine protein kinase [Myxococcota bacterium]
MAEEKGRTAQFGDYTILEHIGDGGMCHVFRARRKGDSHDCALKLLKDERRDDEQLKDLFLTEADVALLLDHPNLIHTFDAGEVRGRYYIAMELIEGRTLGQIMVRAEKLQLPIPPDFSLYVASEMLEGLHALHNAVGRTGRPLGLVHRDVTPQNVFISYTGRVILGDFGVAHIKAYGGTEPGQAVGKIGYLAPEAVTLEELDHRADVFAAGIILWELLTGHRLFHGKSDDALMEDIVEARIPRPRTLEPSIAKGLEALVLKALAKRPRDRFESAEEMLYELEPFWSKQLGNPYAIAAFLAGTFRQEVREWRARRAGVPAATHQRLG